jgi:hypothetical protein
MEKISYTRYRFPPEIIDQAIWLYLRFTLSLRDVEDLLAERGVSLSYETVRRWVNHFGPMIATDPGGIDGRLKHPEACSFLGWQGAATSSSDGWFQALVPSTTESNLRH